LVLLGYTADFYEPGSVRSAVTARILLVNIFNGNSLHAHGEKGFHISWRSPIFDETVLDLTVEKPLLRISRRQRIVY